MRIAEPIQADNPAGVQLSEAAADMVRSLLAEETQKGGDGQPRLRLAVTGRNCSGLVYELAFDDQSMDGDAVSGYDGFEVVVDGVSQPHLSGARVDFVEVDGERGFTIDNPNAPTGCSCGDESAERACGQAGC